jgi:hypothetical protein
LGKKRLKVQLKRLQDDTTDGFSGWDDADVEQDGEFLGTPRNSGTSTKQSTPPNYASHEHKSPAAASTAVKLQDVTKKLHEISLFTPAQVTKNNNKDNNNAVPMKATTVTNTKAKEATTAATTAPSAAPALKDPKN